MMSKDDNKQILQKHQMQQQQGPVHEGIKKSNVMDDSNNIRGSSGSFRGKTKQYTDAPAPDS